MRAAQIRTYHHDIADRPFIVIWEMTQACPLARSSGESGARVRR